MQDAEFKLCPFCKERIRAKAVKCRYCGEWLEQPERPPISESKTQQPQEPASVQAQPGSTTSEVLKSDEPSNEQLEISPDELKLGEQVFRNLTGDSGVYPTRETWEWHFLKQRKPETPLRPEILDKIWSNSDRLGRVRLAEPSDQCAGNPTVERRKLNSATVIYGAVLLIFLITSANRNWSSISKDSLTTDPVSAVIAIVINTIVDFVAHAFLSPIGILCLVLYATFYFNQRKSKKSESVVTQHEPPVGSSTGDNVAAVESEKRVEQNEGKELPAPPVLSQQPSKEITLTEYHQSSAKRRNYFIRHWRGDLSLGVSYWVNGILSTFLVVLVVVLLAQFRDFGGLQWTAMLVLLLYAMALAITVWQLVGVWRSASKHVSRGGSSGWAIAAKVAVIFGILTNLAQLWNTYIPQSEEMFRILTGDTGIPAYQIRILPGGSEVEFRGGLRAGCARELEKILSATPQATVLHIESTGGRIAEAEEMAKLVRQRGLITYTSEYCLSAATLVLISGKERVIESGAKIGFHAGTFPGITAADLPEMNETVRTTMEAAGVSEAFISRVLSTPPEQMWYPSYEEMRAAGVITSQTLGERFASPLGMPDVDFDSVLKSVEAYPGFRTIKQVEPQTFAKMMTNFVAALRSGKSEGEAIGAIQDAASTLMLKYLPSASDEAILGLQNERIEILTRYKDKNSAACIALFTQAKVNYKRAFPDWNMTNSMLVMEKIISSGAAADPIPIDKTAAENDQANALQQVKDKYGDDVQLLYDTKTWPANSQKVCDMLLMLYQQEAALPDKRSANLIRYVMTTN